MALSSCYNCNPVQTAMKAEISPLAWEQLNHQGGDDGVTSIPDYLLDFCFDTASFFCSDLCPHLLPPADMSLAPEMMFPPPLNEIPETIPPSKRQKCFRRQDPTPAFDFEPELVDPFAANSCEVLTFPQLPAFPLQFDPSYAGKNVEEKVVSAQSVAARERRRRISEKTQELGKLIPGGNKMNTAEMLQAASNYVKYLQAQVGVLELMDRLKDSEGSAPTEDMEALLESCSIQGKLMSKEKCMVPREFVATLANLHDVQSRPSIHENLFKLIKLDD